MKSSFHSNNEMYNHLGKIYFLHIPKTAGTSFNRWLSDYFPEDRCLKENILPLLMKVDISRIAECRYVYGHFGWRFNELSERMNFGFDCVTFLREPARREYSNLKYLVEDFDVDVFKAYGEDGEIRRKRILDLRQLSMADRIRKWDADLIANPSQASLPQGGVDPYSGNIQIRNLAHYGTDVDRPVPVGGEELECAKSRLERISFFGIVEEMAWSSVLFADVFGVPVRPMSYNLNRSSDLSYVHPVFEANIRRSSALDYDLYRHSQEIFSLRIKNLKEKHSIPDGAQPEELVEPIERLFLATDRGVPLIDEALIEMADGLVLDGFTQRIWREDACRWYRWAGPSEKSAIYLPLKTDRNFRLRFEVLATMSGAILNGLELWIGESRIALTRRPVQLNKDVWINVFEGCIEKSMVGKEAQYTKIEFRSPEVGAVDARYARDIGSHATFALGNIEIESS